ncbi:MAG: hypothetical protein GF364_04175 [Candidatus Lokiarchaeota archaeon]|nr:hypothetical protein [Candidatus Lokiarchaeota archaeon]
MFKFLVSKIAKIVSRNVNSAFFITLYKEIYKEVNDITKNPVESSQIMKELGIKGTRESANRQESLFKIFPSDPKKVLELLPTMIYQIIFGVKMDEYIQTEEEIEDSDYPAIVFTLKRSSVCGGFGSTNEFDIDFKQCVPDYNGCAAGVVGMLQEVANYVLKTKGSPYRVDIIERKCFNAGDNCMELFCSVIPADQFELITEEDAEKLKRKGKFDIDLNKIEEILTQPLLVIKEKIADLIQDKMHMKPKDFFGHFRLYEEDVIRIFGFLLIHGLNEAGRILEKTIENETYSKIIGHTYNTAREMTKIYIPKEVIDDYKRLFIEILTDLAPEEMVAVFQQMDSSQFVNLFFEGIHKALKDLGVNFDGLKSNMWEELELQKFVEKIPLSDKDAQLTEAERQRLAEIKLKIMQEFIMLISVILSLPSRIIISSTNAAVKSVVDSSGDTFSHVREHTEQLFDLIEKLK